LQRKTILVVDDDPKMCRLLRRCLENEGFDVLEAANEEAVLEALKSHDVSLITLDISLDGESGLVIARNIRQHSNVPIVMVTARSDVIDRVVGLEIGADDYITKPFHVRELAARVRAQIRRAEEFVPEEPRLANETEQLPGTLEFGGMTLDPETLEAHDRAGHDLKLTTADTELLLVFLRNPKRVLSRDRLMTLLGGAEWTPLDRAIDNKVARLRKKIEENPDDPKIIKTVRGVGYKFAVGVKTVEATT
jgi:DNA-binding response OmpR family regulator